MDLLEDLVWEGGSAREPPGGPTRRLHEVAFHPPLGQTAPDLSARLLAQPPQSS